MKRKLAAALIGICLLSGCGKMEEIPELQARDTIYNKNIHLEVPRMVGGIKDGYTAVFTDIGPDGIKQYLDLYAWEKKTNSVEAIEGERFVVEVMNEDETRSLMYIAEQPELKEGAGEEANSYDYAYIFGGFEAKVDSKNKNITHMIVPFHLMKDERLESCLDTIKFEEAYYVDYSMEIIRQFYERYCENYGIDYDSCVNMHEGQLDLKYPLVRSDKPRNMENLEENKVTQTVSLFFYEDEKGTKFIPRIQKE